MDLLTKLRAARFDELALSVYLPPGPALDRRYYQAALKDLEKAQHGLDQQKKVALDRELPGVRRQLELFHPSGKSLCFFSCEPAEMFEARQLPSDPGARLTIGTELDLEPLERIAAEHPPALVVIADKSHARIFTMMLGECEEVAELEGDPVRRHKQGGWSDRRLQRHQDERAEWNLRAAVNWIEAFGPARLPLHVGGPPEARAAFKRMLPKRLQQALAGEFAAQITINATELSERVRADG